MPPTAPAERKNGVVRYVERAMLKAAVTAILASPRPQKSIRGRVPVNGHDELPRNEPCPCGSGRKAKRCCRYADVAAKAKAERLAAGVSSVPEPDLKKKYGRLHGN